MARKAILLLAISTSITSGQTQTPDAASTEGWALRANQQMEISASDQPTIIQQLIEHIVFEAIPRDYENTKKWGTTKEVFDGWHVHAEGLKIETKRKKKRVNHGTWKRYRLTMVDPHQTLKVRLHNPRRLDTGEWETELFLAARLDVEARLQEWQRDIRLLSISAQATADLELRIFGTAATTLDPTDVPPSVVFQPTVKEAELRLLSFKLRRVSKADGPLIRELVGDGIEPLLEELIREKNDELAARLNRQIQKNQDSLRFSIADPLHQAWQKWTKEVGSQDSSGR
jgi:hypothetical protein